MTKQSLLFRLLLIYGSRLPYHPGKGRLHDRLLKLFNVRVDGLWQRRIYHHDGTRGPGFS